MGWIVLGGQALDGMVTTYTGPVYYISMWNCTTGHFQAQTLRGTGVNADSQSSVSWSVMVLFYVDFLPDHLRYPLFTVSCRCESSMWCTSFLQPGALPSELHCAYPRRHGPLDAVSPSRNWDDHHQVWQVRKAIKQFMPLPANCIPELSYYVTFGKATLTLVFKPVILFPFYFPISLQNNCSIRVYWSLINSELWMSPRSLSVWHLKKPNLFCGSCIWQFQCPHCCEAGTQGLRLRSHLPDEYILMLHCRQVIWIW